MTNEKVCFKVTETKEYDKKTGKFSAKAQVYLWDKKEGTMDPNYIRTNTGRKIEEIVSVSGSYPYKPCRFDFYVGVVKSRDDDDIILGRIDRVAPDSVDLLRGFLMRFIKRVKVRKKIIKDFQAGNFQSFQSFLPNLAAANIDNKTNQEIQTNLMNHERYTHIQDFLEKADCSYNSAAKLIIQYGNVAENVLKTAPFDAFCKESLDWLDADKLFLYFKHDPRDHIRCQTAVQDVLQAVVKYRGSVCVELDELVDLAADRLNRDSEETFTKPEIRRIAHAECNIVIEKQFRNAVYLPEQHKLECQLAHQFDRLQSGTKRSIRGYTPMALRSFFCEYTLSNGIKLSDEQVSVIETALTNPITVIHGEAGSGKTVTVRGLVDAIRHFAPHAAIRLCAPTGKAARHLVSVTGMEATTLHSLIFDIEHTRKSPKELSNLDYILIDEAAMLDNRLICDLLEKLSPSCRIILTGDANQLPSIGPGVVFKQLLASDAIMSLKLSRVFRQRDTSDILRLAHDIVQFKNGDSPICLPDYSGDVEYIKHKTEGETYAAVEQKVQSLLATGVSPDSIQVLSPIKGLRLGTRSLNASLANLMNHSRAAQKGNWSGFYVEDKVIQGQNLYEDGKMSVYNGAVGRVTRIVPGRKELFVDFPGSGEVRYDSQAAEMLELAYATTVHKFQGSEAPYVILPMDPTFCRMLNKQLIYTAVTRAKVKLIIIGDERSFQDAVRNDVLEKRISHLSESMDLAAFAA